MKLVTDPTLLALLNAGGGQQGQQPPQAPGIPDVQQPSGNPGTPMNPAIDQKAQMMIYKMFPQLLQQKLAQSMGGSSLNPLQQAQAEYLKAKTSQLSDGKVASQPAAYVNDSGDVSIDPKEGYKPVSKAQLPYVGVSASAKERDKALSSRAEVMARGIDARQIDRLAQTTGITPAQRNLLQQNNMRANRAIELASRPMTWQEFGAITTDAAAIMQGGAPQVQQLHDMSYPSWKEDLARANTFIRSTPTANVPDAFRNRIVDMIKGIQTVDNRYLTKNAEFMQKMLSPTIRGGVDQFKGPISDMTNTITETGGSGQDQSGGWSIQKVNQ